MGRIASFHLVRDRRAATALAHLGLDRRPLRHVDGLTFWRLLGTGRGDHTGPGADLARTALFAVWDEEASIDRFLAAHPVARRWERAAEAWHVRLRGVGGHGRWKGVDPLDGLEQAAGEGPVAIITRADVRRGAWRSFRAASSTVDAELHTAPGLIDVVGIGEAPIGRLATFSLWESAGAARTFAYSMPGHLEVVRRTRAETWYSEELFATFEPSGSSGTWDGRDPLAVG